MDYYTQPLSRTLLNSGADRRSSQRKRLQRRVSLGLTKGAIVQGHTVEISLGGLGVMIPTALAIGEVCAVRFDMLINGESVRIAGIGKVVNCSCSGLDGFRIGMKFTARDPHISQAIDEYVQ